MKPAGVQDSIERGSAIFKDDASIEPPKPDGQGAGEFCAICAQVRFDLLSIAHGRETESSLEASAGEVQGARKTTRIGAKVAVRTRPTHVERSDGNDSSPALRDEDPTVAGERTEARLAIRSIIEPSRGRQKRQAHVANSKRVVRPLKEKLDVRALNPTV